MLKQLNQAEFRNYSGQDDYIRIDEFLIEYHQPNNAHGNWLEPMWEYMHFHPYLDSASLSKIGIWEVAGEIVAVAHFESRLGEAFFQFHPAYRRRCGVLGATVAYVGSDQQFYQAIGFKKVYNSECWLKYFDEEKS